MILTYPVLSVWSKNQPFPQKALSTSRSDNLTLHTKDTLVLLLVRLVSKAGPSRNCSLLSTKGGTQVGYFKKKKPALTPLPNGIFYLFLGLLQSLWSLQYAFKWNNILPLIQEADFLSAYMWDSVLVEGLMLLFQETAGPWCQDSLYWGQFRPGKGSWPIAHHLLSVGLELLTQDEEVWSLKKKQKYISDFSPKVREKGLSFSRSLWPLLELGGFKFSWKVSCVTECG